MRFACQPLCKQLPLHLHVELPTFGHDPNEPKSNAARQHVISAGAAAWHASAQPDLSTSEHLQFLDPADALRPLLTTPNENILYVSICSAFLSDAFTVPAGRLPGWQHGLKRFKLLAGGRIWCTRAKIYSQLNSAGFSFGSVCVYRLTAHRRIHLVDAGAVKVHAACQVRAFVAQQPHHIRGAEVHVVQEHHPVRRPRLVLQR